MSKKYEDALTRMKVPPYDAKGGRNENPEGLGLLELLREDLQTHGNDPFEQGFWAVAVNRLGNWRMGLRSKALRAPATAAYWALYKAVETNTGISLPYTVKLGRRVRIWHHGGMIIGARAIGDDVHLRQNTTIGVAQTGQDNLPVIEAGADIGAGAAILGDVVIGKNAKVGANTVVVTDVPDGATAFGNPAQVLNPRPPAQPSKSTQRAKSAQKRVAKPRPKSAPKAPSQQAKRKPQPPMHDFGTLALLGSANLDYLAMNFKEAAKENRAKLEVFVPPFGQARQMLLLEDSALVKSEPSSTLIVERAEDILGPLFFAPLSVPEADRKAALAERLEPLLQSLQLARQRLQGTIFLCTLGQCGRSSLGQADDTHQGGLTALIKDANQMLREAASALPNIQLIDMERLIAEIGQTRSHPGKYWHLGRIPFSNELSAHLAKRALGAMFARAGKTARLLVLDLDNTLWGGVLGEDGPEGVKLGGPYPGSAFREFQQAIQGLSQRGIALAIASKNDEDLALKMIAEHPQMILRPGDFVTHRIGWEEKSAGIAQMLEEVSLGAASCMFIDDNPVEREKVRRNLPQVCVPDLPTDPELMTSWLMDLPQLECVQLTSSDVRRNTQYKKRAQVERQKRTFANIEDFYVDLQMKLRFEPLGPNNQERALQLLVKTNQFNATTRRHDAQAIRSLQAKGAEVYAVGVQDRFSEYELMGVIVLVPEENAVRIDSLLLSCRILGRTVETAILGYCAQRATAMGKAKLVGEIVETPRNTPIRELYEKHGFSAAGEGRFEWSAERPLQIPSYFTILEPQGA